MMLNDVAVLGANPVLVTPMGVVDESWGAAYPNASAVSAIGAIATPPRPELPRGRTVALPLPISRLRPLSRSLRGFNHYHFHTEHLCSLLQIETVARAWPNIAIETLLPEYDAQQQQAVALLDPQVGTVRPVGPQEMLAERILLRNRIFHYQGPDPLLGEVFARVRRNALAATGAVTGGELVYVSRLGSVLRRIVNEEELAAHMEARGFRIFDARRLSYHQQVLELAAARVIVGPHGAGLTNAGFASPDALFIEFFSPFYYSGCFQNVAAIAGHRYRAWAPRTAGHAKTPQAEWDLDIPAFLGFLDRVLEAEERRGDSQALP